MSARRGAMSYSKKPSGVKTSMMVFPVHYTPVERYANGKQKKEVIHRKDDLDVTIRWCFAPTYY